MNCNLNQVSRSLGRSIGWISSSEDVCCTFGRAAKFCGFLELSGTNLIVFGCGGGPICAARRIAVDLLRCRLPIGTCALAADQCGSSPTPKQVRRRASRRAVCRRARKRKWSDQMAAQPNRKWLIEYAVAAAAAAAVAYAPKMEPLPPRVRFNLCAGNF